MPEPGVYIMQEISKENFIVILMDAYQNGVLESYIGYPQNIELLKEWTGLDIPLSRKTTKVDDGDILLIMKLTYRVKPKEKGYEVSEDDFVFYYANYKK